MPSAAFQTAAADSGKLTSKPGNNELLELYGLFKVANGVDIQSAEKPGMFDLKGKAKYSAWEKEVKEGVTPEQAEERYIALVERLKTSCGYDANKVPEKVGGS